MECHPQMKPKFLGKNLIQFPTIDSTNNYATKLINETNIPNGTVILADFQTNGRGQREKYWDSEALQNLTFSIIYFPNNLLVDYQYTLNKAIALGILGFCNQFSPSTQKPTIKWPNDILINNEKVCGILIENALSDRLIKSSIIGIGININQKIFSNGIKATSLSKITQQDFDLKESLNLLLLYIEKQLEFLEEGLFEKIDLAYKNNLFGINEWRKYGYQGKVIDAKITDISRYGALELETPNKSTIKCGVKEIEFLFD